MEKYALVLTEKPDAAKKIALALDKAGKAKRIVEKGVSYYVAQNEKKIIVAPALGHLYTVTSYFKDRGKYPVFNIRWAPLYETQRGAKRIQIWLEIISKLAQEADTFIDACDYDLEGSVIGYCLLKYACGGKEKEAKRMKYSTLTEVELKKAYSTLLPSLDFLLIEAGLARHEVDWLYGINLSQALTSAAKKASGYYTMLSTGRVQGPTLKFLVTREKSIACFVPIPYWTAKAKIQIGNKKFQAEYEKKTIATKDEADELVDYCKGKNGEIEKIRSRKFMQMPPLPFDLGALQSEAYTFFGYTPMRTSSIAQRLYLDAFISYPRTSSQKLPEIIGYESILKNLAKVREYTIQAQELLSKPELKPNEGKKVDPAHPAIYPTGKIPEKPLAVPEKNIWNLVVRKFLAVFGEPARRQVVQATICINKEKFLLTGKQIMKEGWLRFYNHFTNTEDAPLPPLNEGQIIKVEKVVLENKFTKPPSRYNPRTLLIKMEESNIGTKATRAGTIQTLYDRKYVCDEKMAVSELGFELAEVLRKYCPSVVSVEFTRKLEEKMNAIQQGNETKEKIVADAVKNLKSISKKLKDNEKAIGDRINLAVKKYKLEEKTIGKCPICRSGKLIIIHSKKTRKRFVGCTNYFSGKCKTTFPLPQRGLVKPTEITCKGCACSIVQVFLKGKRPWNLCLNPECPSKSKEEKY